MIADHTAYDVRYTGKLSICWRTAGVHSPIQQVKYTNAPKLIPLKRDWQKFIKSVNNRT